MSHPFGPRTFAPRAWTPALRDPGPPRGGRPSFFFNFKIVWSTKASTTRQSTGGHHRCKYPHNRSWSPVRLLLTSPKYLLVLRQQSILTARQRHHVVSPVPRDAGINKQRGWMWHCCVMRMKCSDSHINADLTCHEFSAVANLEMRWAEQMPSIGLTHVKAQD